MEGPSLGLTVLAGLSGAFDHRGALTHASILLRTRVGLHPCDGDEASLPFL